MLVRATHRSKQPHSAAELAWRLRQHFGAEMTVTLCDEQWLTFSREFESSNGELTAGEMGTVELDQEHITVRLEASMTPFVFHIPVPDGRRALSVWRPQSGALAVCRVRRLQRSHPRIDLVESTSPRVVAKPNGAPVARRRPVNASNLPTQRLNCSREKQAAPCRARCHAEPALRHEPSLLAPRPARTGWRR